MLRKLMKHELRATGRVMGPMLGLTLLAALGGNVAVHGLLQTQSKLMDILGSVLLTAFAAMLAASCIVSFVLMIQRFYRNLLRDEGYLMMTLPVTVHEHVLGKLLVSIFWSIVTAFTVGLAMCMLLFEMEHADMIAQGFAELLGQLRFGDLRMMDYAGHAALFVIEMMLLALAADSCLCLQIYAAMAVGHSFTHHKGLLSFAAYMALSAGWNILQNGALYLLRRLAPQGIRLGLDITPIMATHINLWALVVFLMILAGIWYGITTWFLKNRLNLA